VALLVQLQIGDGEPRGHRGRTALVAPEHGPDTGHQLLDAEGLGHVVVATDGEPAYLLLGGVAGGQEDHRHPMTLRDEALGEAETVLVGEPDVKDDQVRLAVEHSVPGLAGGRGALHREALVAEGHGDQVRDVALVIDHEHPGGRGLGTVHAPDGGTRTCEFAQSLLGTGPTTGIDRHVSGIQRTGCPGKVGGGPRLRAARGPSRCG
jgi:hypothetical protein